MRKRYIYISVLIIISLVAIIIYKSNGQAEAIASKKLAVNDLENAKEVMAEHNAVDEEKKKEIKEAADAKNKKEQEIAKLKEQVIQLIGEDSDNIGIAYYDINSSMGFDINGDKAFVAASTVKVPICMATADLIKKGTISLDQGIKYSSDDYEDGAGILQGTKLLNSPIKINDLMDYALMYSDNIAVNMLLRTITPEYRYSFAEAIVKHPVNRDANETTALDSLEILKNLYFNPDNNQYYSLIINDMKKTEFHDRIDKYIPQNIVAHKIGNYDDYINDIGIIYDEEPYILTVFTKSDKEDTTELIAKISKLIYDNR